MKDTYVTRMSYLTEELLKEANQLDKTDTLYVITEKNGNMPIVLYPYFQALNCKTQMIVSDTDSDIAFGFSLGMTCANNNNGIIYLILHKTDPLFKLHNETFESNKTKISILAQTHFIMKEKDSTATQRTRKPRTIKPKAPITEEVEEETKMNNVANKKETSTYVVEKTTKTKRIDLKGQNESIKILNKKPNYISDKFIKVLETIHSDAFDIDKDLIFLYDAIKNSIDVDALPFQLQMCFGENRKDLIYKAIKGKFNTLKKAVY